MPVSDSDAHSIFIISKMWPTPPGGIRPKTLSLEECCNFDIESYKNKRKGSATKTAQCGSNSSAQKAADLASSTSDAATATRQ